MRHVKEKKERALGVKLFLKADRCNSPKCVMVRRPYRPGQHGQRRTNVSEYGKQLHEKQKIQIYFGLNNHQMRRLFLGSKSRVKEILLQRLDSVVFLLGVAKSSRIARQLISHGHILVNGRKVTIPSYRVTIGNTIAVRPQSRALKIFEGFKEQQKQYTPPSWLAVEEGKLEGKCVASSAEDDTQFPFDIELVAQFYAR
ncbi:MAG: 30S ribosomal protein S4 [Candidatus Jorgensenbacteria bacterium]